MITGEGGFVHRMMPPVDWDCGPIPEKCYDRRLSSRQIEDKLLEVYLKPERVRRLADSDDPIEIFQTECALRIIAEIDAGTIFYSNHSPKESQ